MSKSSCICFAILFLVLSSCRTKQLSVCENVTDPRQIAWLKQILDNSGTDDEFKLQSIEKVSYRSEATNTECIGFLIHYEPAYTYPDQMAPGVYDCDGNILYLIGGVAGCQGDCTITILSRKTIYTAP